MDGGDQGGEDERREAAIGAIAPLQSSFKSKLVRQDQLSKLQELHKRRLQIKAQTNKKSKDGHGKHRGKDNKTNSDGDAKCENSGTLNLKGHDDDCRCTVHQDDDLIEELVPQKRQKLHWGLDTKERWERKANM